MTNNKGLNQLTFDDYIINDITIDDIIDYMIMNEPNYNLDNVEKIIKEFIEMSDCNYVAIDGVFTVPENIDYMILMEIFTEWIKTKGIRFDGSFYEATPFNPDDPYNPNNPDIVDTTDNNLKENK